MVSQLLPVLNYDSFPKSITSYQNSNLCLDKGSNENICVTSGIELQYLILPVCQLVLLLVSEVGELDFCPKDNKFWDFLIEVDMYRYIHHQIIFKDCYQWTRQEFWKSIISVWDNYHYILQNIDKNGLV